MQYNSLETWLITLVEKNTHVLSIVWCGWRSPQCCRWWWGPDGPHRTEGFSGLIWCGKWAHPSPALSPLDQSALTAGFACSRMLKDSKHKHAQARNVKNRNTHTLYTVTIYAQPDRQKMLQIRQTVWGTNGDVNTLFSALSWFVSFTSFTLSSTDVPISRCQQFEVN